MRMAAYVYLLRVSPSGNGKTYIPLSLRYATPLTDGLHASISCNLPTALSQLAGCVYFQRDLRFLPEVERHLV